MAGLCMFQYMCYRSQLFLFVCLICYVMLILTMSLHLGYYGVSLLRCIATCNTRLPLSECGYICKIAGGSSPLELAFPPSLSPSLSGV